ncbi:MAG: transcriptional regulator [Chloroflexi bacterium]|nr:transcriptional regulator [Chloroflexota bacterium]
MPTPSVSNPRKRPAVPVSAVSDASRLVPGERRDADRHHGRPASADQSPWPDLDRLIHERLRLGIVSALAVNQTMTFNDLRNLLGTTDGNLSVHARKLEEAGYVRCRKSFDGRVPRTDFDLTDVGRRALEDYLGAMEALIARTRRPGEA